MQLNELLRETMQSHSSDLHLCAGQPPVFRTDGGLVLSTLHTHGAPLQTNGQVGMRTMESSVKDLLDRGIIGEGDWQAF